MSQPNEKPLLGNGEDHPHSNGDCSRNGAKSTKVAVLSDPVDEILIFSDVKGQPEKSSQEADLTTHK